MRSDVNLYGKPKITAYLQHADFDETESATDDAATTADSTGSIGGDITEITRFTLTDVDFVQGSLVFRHGTSASGEITIGAAIAGSCNFSLRNDDGKFDEWEWRNSIIDITLDFNGKKAYMGYYYIVSHTTTGNVIKVEALDALKIMDVHMLYEVGIQWPIDAISAINKLVNYGLDTPLTIKGFDNLPNVMLYDPGNDRMTNRDALSYIVQLLGKYVTMRGQSKDSSYVSFDWYDSESRYDAGVTFDHDLQTNAITVTGVNIMADDDDSIIVQRGEDGYRLDISDNPFIVKDNIEVIADLIGAAAIGLGFVPGSFTVEANARIEAGDAIAITTAEMAGINTLATNLTYRPYSVRESITADAPSVEGDLQISIADYVRKVVKSEVKKYADGIGGRGGLSLDQLYKELRPSDWLTLPNAGLNECYILWLIPEHTYQVIGLTAITSDQKVNIEVGTIEAGSFRAMYSGTASKGYYNNAYTSGSLYADDFGNLTSDGFCQVVMRAYVDSGYISRIDTQYQLGPRAYAEQAGCVEIVSGSTKTTVKSKDCLFLMYNNVVKHAFITETYLPSLIVARGCVGSSDMSNLIGCELLDATDKVTLKSCRALEYAGINLDPSGDINLLDTFVGCESITTFQKLELKTDSSITLQSTCASMTNLRSIGDIVAGGRLEAYGTFSSCVKLARVGNIVADDAAKYSSDTRAMFSGCTRLTRTGDISIGKLSRCSRMFELCHSLQASNIKTLTDTGEIAALYSGCASILTITITISGDNVKFGDDCFAGCTSLKRLAINSDGWSGSSINLADSSLLTRENVVNLFTALPTAGGSYTITLNSTAKSRLSETEIAIATDKGYTVV